MTTDYDNINPFEIEHVGNVYTIKNTITSNDVDKLLINVSQGRFIPSIVVNTIDTSGAEYVHINITDSANTVVVDTSFNHLDLGSSVLDKFLMEGSYTITISGEASYATDRNYELTATLKSIQTLTFDSDNMFSTDFILNDKNDGAIYSFVRSANYMMSNINAFLIDSVYFSVFNNNNTEHISRIINASGIINIIQYAPLKPINTDDKFYITARLVNDSTNKNSITLKGTRVYDYSDISSNPTVVSNTDNISLVNTVFNGNEDYIEFDISDDQYIPWLKIYNVEQANWPDMSFNYRLTNMDTNTVVNENTVNNTSPSSNFTIATNLVGGTYQLFTGHSIKDNKILFYSVQGDIVTFVPLVYDNTNTATIDTIISATNPAGYTFDISAGHSINTIHVMNVTGDISYQLLDASNVVLRGGSFSANKANLIQREPLFPDEDTVYKLALFSSNTTDISVKISITKHLTDYMNVTPGTNIPYIARKATISNYIVDGDTDVVTFSLPNLYPNPLNNMMRRCLDTELRHVLILREFDGTNGEYIDYKLQGTYRTHMGRLTIKNAGTYILPAMDHGNYTFTITAPASQREVKYVFDAGEIRTLSGIIKYCRNRVSETKSAVKLKSSMNDTSISQRMRYAQYIRSAKPRLLRVQTGTITYPVLEGISVDGQKRITQQVAPYNFNVRVTSSTRIGTGACRCPPTITNK